ncbi:DUF6483 family protein [Agrilactobacillus fermenti]|uniref:DUF6483 family protein n=1 Tax=Agrilactobacillus fermenti TaxID=2586909 RepID=UPI001E59567D|nr:DUF6483 family protein [Agrilactobacillus fermenti]MCD2255900.1 hypothetical protein [Agrilactobacillus fermenti]
MPIYEDDPILRQIKAFAQGLGYILTAGKGGNSETEIVFPGQQDDHLTYQETLQKSLAQHQYQVSIEKLFRVRYAISEENFLKLGLWYAQQLNLLSAAELKQGNFSKQDIQSLLDRLQAIQEQ